MSAKGMSDLQARIDELLSENGNKNQYKYLIFRNILQESYSPVSDVEIDVSVSAKIMNKIKIILIYGTSTKNFYIFF